jgi:single-stranded DNA-binding protein
MLNHVTLIGKVTDAGPKLTYSDNGQPECRWVLAIEESGAQGKVYTTYIPCSAWGKAAETIAAQLDTGGRHLPVGRRVDGGLPHRALRVGCKAC